MSRAVVVAFHKYTPFGDEFFEPILESFMKRMAKYQNEFEMLYLIDSTWNIGSVKESWGIDKIKIIKVDPSLRYYDAYKQVLPQIEEDLVLFMDNDMVVYREGKIVEAFTKIGATPYHVASIYDTIGNYTHPALGGKSKFCPYWFSAPKRLLEEYSYCDWGSNMPHYETLGKLTQEMIAHDIKPYEFEEDKSNCLFDGTQDGEKSKDLGYYHVRAGSTVAYLLATKKYGDSKTYWDYLNNQPRTELLRHCAWYEYMLEDVSPSLLLMLLDMKVTAEEFYDYMNKFRKYHGL